MDCKTSAANVCVVVSEGHVRRAVEVAETYGIAIANSIDYPLPRFRLTFIDNALALVDGNNLRSNPIAVPARRTSRLAKTELLGQAVGRKTKTVIDATAGWGKDAFLMARMGFAVTAIEASPAIAAMLADGIERNRALNPFLQISHRFGDFKSSCSQLQRRPDAVYLDPLYPPGRKKSVKVKRSIELLKLLATTESNFDELFQVAIAVSEKRVIVKRPHFAPAHQASKLSFCLCGKLVRYDVYLTPKL